MPPAEVPDGSVYVTPKQMYELILQVRDDVRDVRSAIVPGLATLRDVVTKHETRLSAVERLVWRATGAAAVLSSVGAVVLSRLIGG